MGHRVDDDRQRACSASERLLLQQFQDGDPGAFQALLRPHLPALLALAHRHCRDPHWAEDLLQETLVRAYRALPAFRGDAALRTWLFRILLRLAMEPRRWQRGTAATAIASEVPDHLGDTALQSAIARELDQQLDAALERLPQRQRTALHLRAVEGMDYQGIAEVLECSVGAARMLVLEARRKILLRLGEHLEP